MSSHKRPDTHRSMSAQLDSTQLITQFEAFRVPLETKRGYACSKCSGPLPYRRSDLQRCPQCGQMNNLV